MSSCPASPPTCGCQHSKNISILKDCPTNQIMCPEKWKRGKSSTVQENNLSLSGLQSSLLHTLAPPVWATLWRVRAVAGGGVPGCRFCTWSLAICSLRCPSICSLRCPSESHHVILSMRSAWGLERHSCYTVIGISEVSGLQRQVPKLWIICEERLFHNGLRLCC